MVNSHFIKFLLGEESFYKVFSNDSYDQLHFHIFAWLGLNPDYAPVCHHPVGHVEHPLKPLFRCPWHSVTAEEDDIPKRQIPQTGIPISLFFSTPTMLSMRAKPSQAILDFDSTQLRCTQNSYSKLCCYKMYRT